MIITHHDTGVLSPLVTRLVGMHHNVAMHIAWGLEAKQLRKIFLGVVSIKHSTTLLRCFEDAEA